MNAKNEKSNKNAMETDAMRNIWETNLLLSLPFFGRPRLRGDGAASTLSAATDSLDRPRRENERHFIIIQYEIEYSLLNLYR